MRDKTDVVNPVRDSADEGTPVLSSVRSSASRARSHRGRLLIIAALFSYFLLALLVPHIGRGPSYDEAVYLTQMMPGVPAAAYTAPRSRGIVFLVAPFTLVHAPLLVIRIWMVFLTTLGLWFAFRLWRPLVAQAAYVGGCLFALSWVAVFYAGEIMPNAPSALLAVAAVAAYIRYAEAGTDKRAAWVFAGLLCALGLMRPLDATAVAAALFFDSLVFRRKWNQLATLATATFLAWLPWVIEAFMIFRGPIRRLHSVGENVGNGLRNNFIQHLALADGPMLGPEKHLHISWGSILWWSCLGIFAMVGWLATNDRAHRSRTRIAIASAVMLAVPYLFFEGKEGSVAPRFLLPAYALLAIAAGGGIVRLWRVSRIKWALPWLAIALFGWHFAVLRDNSGVEAANRAGSASVAAAVRAASGNARCAAITAFGSPQLSLQARCMSTQMFLVPRAIDPSCSHSCFRTFGDQLAWLRNQPHGVKIFVLAPLNPVTVRLLKGLPPGWKMRRIPIPNQAAWAMYFPPGQR